MFVSRLLAVVLALASGAALAQPLAAEKDGGPGTVSFVLGSDTSTPGISVSRRTTLYHASGFALFTTPTGNAARVMADAFRQRYTDSYGTPVRLTWWMQNGSLYRDAENTNVPRPSTLSSYLMRENYGVAMERHGDEFTFHYHTWVWNDDNGDGRYFWNQARAFEGEVREDFDQTMADGLLYEGMYPASFRSGWHFMDNAWQARLDELIPFSLHSDAPYAHDDREEPINNLFDWSRAPLAFVPYRPQAEDYQSPGGTGGWNVRSVGFTRVNETLIRGVFEAARGGDAQVACLWDHLATGAFVDRLENVLAIIEAVAADYPDVPFRYETAAEGMRRWQGRGDDTPPTITLEPLAGGTRYRVTTSEPIFQPEPFVAALDRYERSHILPLVSTGPLAWETAEPLDLATLAKVAAAVTDSAGHIATATHRVLPDDIYADNRDADYAELASAWSTVGTTNVDQVWGTDFRAAPLAAGAEAVAQWAFPIETAARYHAFVRMPDVDDPASGVTITLLVDGAPEASQTFPEPLPTDVWVFAGGADLAPGQTATVEIRASGDDQPGRVLAADVVKLSALVRDRQLALDAPDLDLGDAITGDPTPATIQMRNLGTEPLTISGLDTPSGVVVPDAPLPIVLGGLETRAVPVRLVADAGGIARDTLTITSDDPITPSRRVPVQAFFRGPFDLVDNDDDAYSETGDWRTSFTQAYGASSRYSFTTAAGTPEATFALQAPRTGAYALSYIVPRATNSAIRATYEVDIDGEPAFTVQTDQNPASGLWRPLGTLDLEAGAAVTVRVRSTDRDQPGRVLRTDAVLLERLGDELLSTVLDDDDAAAYSETGSWSSSVAQGYGTSSRYAQWGGDPRATFATMATHTGPHTVEMIVPTTSNASQEARYRVLRNGDELGEVVLDQNEGSGAWVALGTWAFASGDEIKVEVSNAETQNSGRVLRSDAVRFRFGAPVGSEASPEAALVLGPLRPNPASGAARVTVQLPAPGRATVEVFDVLGRRVAVLVDDDMTAGEHEIALDLRSLAPGVYVGRLRAGGAVVSGVWTVAGR